MASQMIRPETVTFLNKMLKRPNFVFRVEDITLPDHSPLIHKTLHASGILERDGVSVAALKKEMTIYLILARKKNWKQVMF